MRGEKSEKTMWFSRMGNEKDNDITQQSKIENFVNQRTMGDILVEVVEA